VNPRGRRHAAGQVGRVRPADEEHDGRVPRDDLTRRLLLEHPTIVVVGCSTTPGKAAHSVPAAMLRHGWDIVPVHPTAREVLGRTAYPTLADVPGEIGLVDVFRPSAQAADFAQQAVDAGATAIWLQLGIVSAEAREIAEAAGLDYVEDHCLAVERARYDLSRRPAA
jgi:uncharacterized protein